MGYDKMHCLNMSSKLPDCLPVTVSTQGMRKATHRINVYRTPADKNKCALIISLELCLFDTWIIEKETFCCDPREA